MSDFFWIVLFGPLVGAVLGIPTIIALSFVWLPSNESVDVLFGASIAVFFMLIGYAIAARRWTP